jgi:hypothetical protein
MVRYSFPVGLFHSLLHAGLSRRTDRPLDPLKPFIDAILKADTHAPRKQRHTT